MVTLRDKYSRGLTSMLAYGSSDPDSPATSGTPSVKRTKFRGANVSPLCLMRSAVCAKNVLKSVS